MIDQLLAELRRRQVRIWADGGRLRYDAPPGAVDQECVALLRRHREQLLERLEAVALSAPAAIPAADRDQALPLSSAQQRMWMQWKLAPLSAAYNVAFVVKLTGRVEVDGLARALGEIRRRHEVLRTRFVETADGVAQVVAEASPFELPYEEAESEAAAWRSVRQRAAQPFDLARRAPFEARLYRLDEALSWLFVKLHHIVADVGSFSIFLHELAALYKAPARTLPEPVCQYADFAAWERRRLQGAARDELLSYWKSQLAGNFAPVKLVTDRPRGAVETAGESGPGERVAFQLPHRLSTRLAEVGRRARATRFMLLVSAFRILLFRYTAQPDVLIGTPALCRNLPGTQHLIGYFGNTLALRNPLAASDSYLDVLARERRIALEAYEHQELPFELLVDTLAHERQLPSGPLVQVMFSLAEGEPAAPWPSGLRAEAEEVETSTAKFDLLVAMQQTDGELGGVIEYPTHLFDRETVERLVGHFELVLSEMARQPQGGICETPILMRSERELLREWNDSGDRGGGDRCLHEAFAAQVAARGQAIAVHYEDQEITYAELNDEANRIAHRLRRCGLQGEPLVAVCLRRTPRLIAALLGVLKAGAAYVPVDPLYPAERVRSMLDDCRARVLISEPDVARALPRWDGTLLLLGEDRAPAPASLALRQAPGSLAYVLYTSGSTGTPKGVMIEHRSAMGMLDWAYGVYDTQELAVVLAATSVCFDLSVFEIFAPLCAGQSVVLAENALALPHLAARHRITLINTVPSVMRALLETGADAFPSSLEVVNLAGERLETPLVDEVYRRTGAAKVYDLYGPTEATTYSTFELRLPGEPASIGRPVSGTRCHVLDPRGLPVPVGVIGELYLAGGGLARGYLRRPGLTAERFVPPPWGEIGEERLYRTGDLVRYTGEGDLTYQGRVGDQLKIRGFRIEPAEVRAALLSAEGIGDAWVLGRKSPGGEMDLVAYVVADPSRFSARRLRLHLRSLLPGHMVPSRFARVGAIPLTANGKVDLGRLAARSDLEQEAGAELPATETERQILAIWREVLGVERCGVHDHFFDLGGHSLSGIRVTARIGAALGVVLPLQAILRHPTVSALAAEVDRARAVRATALPPLRAGSGGASPTTLVQRRLWLTDRLAKDPLFLNLASCIGLRGPLDLGAARRALQALARRHPTLRARFYGRDRQLWQETAAGRAVDVVVTDLSALGDEAQRLRGLESVHAKAAGRFDLDRGPCARFVLTRLAEDHHVVTMIVHHIVADEWSLGVLGREFTVDYEALATGLPSPLEAPELTFGDYAAWERRCLEDGLFDEQVARWKEILRPPLRRLAFAWRTGRDGAAEEIESYPVEIGPRLSTSLAERARQEQTSLFVVLLSALARLLERYGGSSDVRVATNLASRHQQGVENMIGPLTDSLVLRTELPADATPLGALRSVRGAFVTACGHHDIPFEELVRRLGSETGIERKDLAQVFFLFDEEPAEMQPFAGLTTEPVAVAAQADFFKSSVHDYDLILHLNRVGGGLRGTLTLKGELAGGEVAADLLQTYHALLEELAEDAIAA